MICITCLQQDIFLDKNSISMSAFQIIVNQ